MEKFLLIAIGILITDVIGDWLYPAFIPFIFLMLVLILIPSLVVKK